MAANNSHLQAGTSCLVLLMTTLISQVAADYTEACVDKQEGDACEWVSNESTCCEMIGGGSMRYCEDCHVPGAKTVSVCSIHSRHGTLGCFSVKEDAPVFQVCIGFDRGDACKFNSGRTGNTTGYCIAHYDHGGVMCLQAVGTSDECEGKGVGEPCENENSENAICSHHPRRGNMMCSTPTEEGRAYIVCQGKDQGAACQMEHDGSHGTIEGWLEGICYQRDEGEALLCVEPSATPAPTAAASSEGNGDEGLSDAIIGVVVACVAGVFILASAALFAFKSKLFRGEVEGAKNNQATVIGTPVTA